jgi:hypothetical protein
LNTSKSNPAKSGYRLLYLFYDVGLPEPLVVLNITFPSTLGFLWNKEQITVKVEEMNCRNNVSAIIGIKL